MSAINTAGQNLPIAERSYAYVMTVRMVNGQVAPEDLAAVEAVRQAVSIDNKSTRAARKAKAQERNAIAMNKYNGWVGWETKHGSKYVKLQGRLGKNNPKADRYSSKRRYNAYQCIRLADAAFADVYIYER
jgi:hypothetical protein